MLEYDPPQWLSIIRGEIPQPSDDYIVIAFPTDELREMYLRTVHQRSENEVRNMLRTFLSASRPSPLDDIHLAALRKRVVDSADGSSLNFSEYERNLILFRSGKIMQPPLPGVSWVLERVSDEPTEAIATISAYLSANYPYMSDWKIHGLTDAMTVIRHRYILQDQAARDSKVAVLRTLRPRDIEFLVAAVYQAEGYEVEVTPEQKDGGKDVIARKGRVEIIYIECKNWEAMVDVDPVRALAGVAHGDGATRAALVSISGFTEKGDQSATTWVDTDPNRPLKVELIRGEDLVLMLNTHFGSSWHHRVDYLIASQKPTTRISQPN
jgi:restriction system protein